MNQSIFTIAFDDRLSVHERFAKIGRESRKLFQDDGIGCLMGVVTIDAPYGKMDLMEPIRSFLDDWADAFANLYLSRYEQADAQRLARPLVAEFEGAILLARIYNNISYIDAD